jgi:hypothetical protein
MFKCFVLVNVEMLLADSLILYYKAINNCSIPFMPYLLLVLQIRENLNLLSLNRQGSTQCNTFMCVVL